MSFSKAIRSWSLQQKIGASFTVVLVLLLAVVFVTWQNMADYLDVSNRTNKSHQVVEGISRLSSSVQQAVYYQRNYIISADMAFYADYSKSLEALNRNYDELKPLIKENPTQKVRLQELKVLLDQRVVLLNEGISRRQASSREEVLLWVAASDSFALSRKIDQQFAVMQNDAQQVLGTSSREVENKAALMIFSFLVGVALVGIIMTVIYTIANRELQERLRVEEVLRESERRYALAALGTNDGLWDWNMETNEIYFSPRWKIILGYQDHEISNTPDEWFRVVHPDDLPALKEHIAKHLEGYAANLEYEYRMLHKEGDVRWVVIRGVSAYDDLGKPNRIAGSLSDITDRKLDEVRLLYDASHDALTGLYNRQFFMQELEVEMSSAKRYHYPLSLCMGDLDRFKDVNDVYGHLTGDNVLISFASLIKRQLRSQDVVGRFGGDEFCFYFPHTDTEEVRTVLERIRVDFEQMVFIAENGEQFSLTCTFGVTALSANQKEGKDLIGVADQALYKAKEFRNSIEIIDETRDTSETAS